MQNNQLLEEYCLFYFRKAILVHANKSFVSQILFSIQKDVFYRCETHDLKLSQTQGFD
jgi:hypothetical protein